MKTDHYRKAIAIYLRGKALDPHAVTAALGVHPSYSQQRGEPWGPPTLNCSEPARVGLWSLRVESDWGSVSDGVTRLLAALPADRSGSGTWRVWKTRSWKFSSRARPTIKAAAPSNLT